MNYDSMGRELIECGLIILEFILILFVITFIAWKRGAFNSNK